MVRQAERMRFEEEEDRDVQIERQQRDVKMRDEQDEEMDEQEGPEVDDEDSRMVMMLTPDEQVQKAISKIKKDVEECKRDRRWNDDVENMKEALEREGVQSAIMEVFSPERVNGMAARLGVMPGLSLDMTSNDPTDGKPWDFNTKEKRDKALDMVLGKRALLVIGSPMCRAFSKLQNWNFKRMKPEKRDKMIAEGRAHLRFCMMLYRIQVENGMYFLHEHPYSATSWKEPIVQEVMAINGV